MNDVINVKNSELDFLLGKKWFFRTVTYHILGKVERIVRGNTIELSDACWVADSGRFSNSIATGSLEEAEVLGKWYVNIDATTDFGEWTHDVPSESI